MDGEFIEAVRTLEPGAAGTGSRAWLLYGLLRTVRPARLLEVGVGYTTLFLLRAMADNAAAAREEARRLERDGEAGGHGLLDPSFHRTPHEPRLVACDRDEGRMERVRRVAEELGLAHRLDAWVGDFRELPADLPSRLLPFDFAFFDCGGAPEYVAFLRSFWPLVARDHGHLVLDFTYWTRTSRMEDGNTRSLLLPGSVLNEIKRQQGHAGVGAAFEAVSLVEPQKPPPPPALGGAGPRPREGPGDLRGRGRGWGIRADVRRAGTGPPYPSATMLNATQIRSWVVRVGIVWW